MLPQVLHQRQQERVVLCVPLLMQPLTLQQMLRGSVLLVQRSSLVLPVTARLAAAAALVVHLMRVQGVSPGSWTASGGVRDG